MIYYKKILLLLFIISISISCEKKFLDYRNKFIGKYNFEYHFSFTILDSAQTTSDTNIIYEGLIKYGGKKQLLIQWFDGTNYEFEVENSGIISKCSKNIGKMDRKEFQLEFDDNLCSPGPLGANSYTNLTGTKK